MPDQSETKFEKWNAAYNEHEERKRLGISFGLLRGRRANHCSDTVCPRERLVVTIS